MATAKTAEKKSTTKKASGAAAETARDAMDALATDILVTLLYRALVQEGEPARVGELVREIGEDAISTNLARSVMETHPRQFVSVDRRWDINSRYLDAQHPVERTLEELLQLYGAPMPTHLAAAELAQIYSRVTEHFDEVAPRLLRGARFFPVAQGQSFGLRTWLLDTSADAEADVLFFNYLSEAAVAPFAAAAKSVDWENDPVGAARQVIAAGNGQPVDNRILQLFAWRALGEDFDPAGLFNAWAGATETLLCLPDHRWLLTESLAPIRARWSALAAHAPEAAEEPAAAAAPETPAKPLEITEADRAEIRSYFQQQEEIVTVPDLLKSVFEIAPGARTFAADVQTLAEYLRSRPGEFLWVGADRFRAPGTLPPYIGQIPESLTFPTLPRFETADGEILDQMLEDQGFADDLREAILDPVAQDVNDQEPADKTLWPEGVSAESPSLRLVLKAHHKEIGTFPLAQVPPGFFSTEPNIVELTLRDAAGGSFPIYVDYDVQLLYGLFDVYADIAAESGAVFFLEKTDNPAEYRFVYNNETDSNVFVNPNRLDELMEFRAEVEGGAPVSTYDIIRRILDHYRKGCSFLTLLTEVNLVRRTPRRLVASILSGYLAFHERANRWAFDPKKEPEGFDKRMTPFIVKK